MKNIGSGLAKSQKTYRARAIKNQILKKCEQYMSKKKDQDMKALR